MQPLNIYIHIPFCFSKCPYCAFFSCTNFKDHYDEYFKILNKEILSKAQKFKDREIQTIYIGGGTPNLVSHKYISEVINSVRDNFTLISQSEISIELYPQYITAENVNAYKEAGINRVSIGLQATKEDDLKQLGRRYSFEDFLMKLNLLKKEGFENIGVDLIFGYPGHTLNGWQDTLKLVTDLDIQHLSCYSLEVEDNTPYGDLNAQNKLILPTEEKNREMYHFACKYLEEVGFEQYEISNWCKNGFECKHNFNFWHYQDYLGIGAGAYSRVGGFKSHNIEDIDGYIKEGWSTQSEEIDEELLGKEKMILELRLNEGIPFNGSIFQEEYMQKVGEKMSLNSRGKDLYNKVIEKLL